MDLRNMSTEDLRKKLDVLEEDLDEVTLEKTMVLSQTGLHISSKKIQQQAKEFAESMERIHFEIRIVEEEIKRRGN